jgi:TusA-related sulfurtransferase
MSDMLDLRGVSCPLNFVKTKLFLDKVASGTVVEVILDAGEPVDSVYSSISAEGHHVEEPKANGQGAYSLLIRKA